MKIGLRRVALASVLTVAVAAAGVVPGAAASGPASARDAAAAVQRLYDELDLAVTAGDVPAMRWSLGELTPLLADLQRGERYAVADQNQAAVAGTSAEATSVKERIETLLPQQRIDLPPITELLNMLLQQLLSILSDLFNNLLGGGVPLPLPPPVP
jgi:hypothetical protein